MNFIELLAPCNHWKECEVLSVIDPILWIHYFSLLINISSPHSEYPLKLLRFHYGLQNCLVDFLRTRYAADFVELSDSDLFGDVPLQTAAAETVCVLAVERQHFVDFELQTALRTFEFAAVGLALPPFAFLPFQLQNHFPRRVLSGAIDPFFADDQSESGFGNAALADGAAQICERGRFERRRQSGGLFGEAFGVQPMSAAELVAALQKAGADAALDAAEQTALDTGGGLTQQPQTGYDRLRIVVSGAVRVESVYPVSSLLQHLELVLHMIANQY